MLFVNSCVLTCAAIFFTFFLQLQKIVLYLVNKKNTAMKTETTEPKIYDLTLLTISDIADMILQKERVAVSAMPYVKAMQALDSIEEMYGQDSGKSIVLYFLSNAGTMRGDFMRAVKKELNQRLASKASKS